MEGAGDNIAIITRLTEATLLGGGIAIDDLARLPLKQHYVAESM